MAILNDTPRIPPQNIEAEQAVLGAILSDNKNLEKVFGNRINNIVKKIKG